jgi:hypothetical protein
MTEDLFTKQEIPVPPWWIVGVGLVVGVVLIWLGLQ